MSTGSPYERLPKGPNNHPEECVCRLHERGVWAGYDPVSGMIHLPGSPPGISARTRVENHFRLRFAETLGPNEWQVAKARHERQQQMRQEARWRRGQVTPTERLSSRWIQGVRNGRWPAEE